ncbi:nucleotidyl transferase AbiEii/AbiGii toxin family protein [Micromonospora sp. LOL_023]
MVAADLAELRGPTPGVVELPHRLHWQPNRRVDPAPTTAHRPPARRRVTSEEFQAEVARLALVVASRHGFALAGGHALIAHGVVDRPTEDVDLFTDQTGGSLPPRSPGTPATG